MKKYYNYMNVCRVKHGNMVVGNSLTGKSTSWKILSQALTRIYHEKTTK